MMNLENIRKYGFGLKEVTLVVGPSVPVTDAIFIYLFLILFAKLDLGWTCLAPFKSVCFQLASFGGKLSYLIQNNHVCITVHAFSEFWSEKVFKLFL